MLFFAAVVNNINDRMQVEITTTNSNCVYVTTGAYS